MSVAVQHRRAAAAFLGSTLVMLLIGSPASAQPGLDFDTGFLITMVDHHAMAVAMSERCEGRAVHQELLTLGAQIAAAQAAEIAQMQDWLGQWYGRQHEPVMSTEGLQHLEMLGETTGEEFEVMFLRMMIAHHLGALKKAYPCTDQAQHAQLVEFCEEMRTTQAQEFEQMRTWLCDWYGLCAPDDQTSTSATTWGAMKVFYR